MKKKINFRLILILSASIAVGALAVVVVHACQVGPEAASLLTEADRAEQAGDLGRAADYLKRRLAYTPQDVDILERYGRILDKQAVTTEDKERVLSVYEEALALEPARLGVRRAAVDLAMESGDFQRARDHLELLAHYRPGDAEVQDLLGQCEEAIGEAEKAETAYRQAVTLAPDRVGACGRLARLLRGLGREADADQVMDAMVAANGGAAAAYLERAIYRMAGASLEDAEKDAARARELAPDDARVLLTAADLADRRGRDDDARAALRQGLKGHPDDMALRLALATLELQTGRPKEAAECLEEEREAIKGKKPAVDESELINFLAEARLKLGETAAVEALAAEARRDGRIGTADYLTARLRMHEGRWGEAERALEDSARSSVMSVDQAVRTLLCLGACYQKLGDGDRRLGVLRQAAALAPWSAPAGAALGAALLDAGRTDEALDRLRRTALLPQAPEEAQSLLARALLLHDQALPRNRQDWTEVDRVLARCGSTGATARLRAAALRARGDEDQATAVLEQARSAHPDDPTAWTAPALDAARRGDAARATALLEEARRRLGDRVEFRLAALQIAEAADGGGGVTPPLRDLEKGLDGWSAEDRTLLLCRLAEAYYRIGKMSEGDRLCRLLAAGPATDLGGRVLLLEAVLASADDGLIDGVLADTARLEGEDGAWARYGRAAHLAARAYRGDRGGLAEAKTLLDELSRSRPDWSRVALLQGRLAELDGDSAAALDAYQRAFGLGERRPDVAQPLLHLLMERGRWDEADQAMRALQEQTVFGGALARQAAEIALQTHNGERAAELARRAAPAVDAYAYHVWLGRVLDAAGRPEEAEIELRGAVHFPDAGWDATAALASHLARQGQTQEAETVVEELKASLPSHYAALPLAACYEAAGRLDLADQYYDEALAKRPDDGPTLVRVAAFDLRLNRSTPAETVLRHLLASGKDASAADLAWARRELAMVLATAQSAGDDGKLSEATARLGDGPAPGEGAADRRARAFVLGAHPAGRAEALRRLEEERQAGPLPPDEEFRLAQLYNADGRWSEARDRLGGLVAVDQQNPEYLAYLIDGLLRHGQAEEAGPWVTRLEGLEPGSGRVKALRERMAANR